MLQRKSRRFENCCHTLSRLLHGVVIISEIRSCLAVVEKIARVEITLMQRCRHNTKGNSSLNTKSRKILGVCIINVMLETYNFSFY